MQIKKIIITTLTSMALGAALCGCGPSLKPNPNQQFVTHVAPNDPARTNPVDELNPYIGQSGTQGNPYYPEFGEGSTSSYSRTPIEQDNQPLYTEEVHYTQGQRYLQHTIEVHGQEHRYLIEPNALHDLLRITYQLPLNTERLQRAYALISTYSGHTQTIESEDTTYFIEHISELEELIS